MIDVERSCEERPSQALGKRRPPFIARAPSRGMCESAVDGATVFSLVSVIGRSPPPKKVREGKNERGRGGIRKGRSHRGESLLSPANAHDDK